MIVVCEPTCRGMDHERVNSGFLCALASAYPDEALRVYADPRHAAALRKNLKEIGSAGRKSQFIPIRLPALQGKLAMAWYRRIFKKVFDAAAAAKVQKVFILSFDVETLRAVKQLKRLDRYGGFKLCFVVHGLVEAVIEPTADYPAVTYPVATLPQRSLRRKLRRAAPHQWPQMLCRFAKASLMARPKIRKALGIDAKSVREVMEEAHSIDYRYIFLAPHAVKNAAVHLPAIKNECFAVKMPVKMLELRAPVRNDFAKFAAYGNVDALALYNVARAVCDRGPQRPYEIRLIGANHFAVDGIPNVTCVGEWGRKLDRMEMEAQAADIDFILMLFDKTRYRLTCSGVLFEALSLGKPIIHFESECVDQFNTAENPIGIRCVSFEDYIGAMVEIIENYDEKRKDILSYKRGITGQRELLQAEDVPAAVQTSFEWQNNVRTSSISSEEPCPLWTGHLRPRR